MQQTNGDKIMAACDQWMPLDIGSYKGDTGHLTYDQHGPYIFLLMHYWKRGPLPADDVVLARIAQVPFDIWTTQIGPVVRDFFVLQDDGKLHQKRADAEMEKRKRISNKRSIAGKAGMSKRWEGKTVSEIGHEASSKGEHITSAISNADQKDNTCYNLLSVSYVQEQVESKEVSKIPEAKKLLDAEASPSLPDGLSNPAPSGQLKPVAHKVWSEGLEILAWVSNRLLPQDRDAVVKLLVKVRQAARGDDDMLLDVLRSVNRDKPPEKQTLGVIKSMIAERGGVALKSDPPRLVVNNNPDDPYGIQAWCTNLPGVRPAVRPDDLAVGKWLYEKCILDGACVDIAEAAELEPSWRGDWSMVAIWMDDGLEYHEIVERIEVGVKWMRKKNGDYIPPVSFRVFDTFVRGGRRAA